MSRLPSIIVLAAGVAAGAAGGYWYARALSPTPMPVATSAAATPAAERKILYYRDPNGAPYWSATPKKDANGRDYLPVYEDEELSFDPQPAKPKTAQGERKILYYRNPMGLADTSPIPKKDWMGMDYIPVYEGEEQDDGKTVKVSLDKVQRSGVRTEPAEPRVIVSPVRGVGTAKHDEARLTVVTTRSDGFVENLFVSRTGQNVHAGEPLFRMYSPEIVRAQVDLLVSIRAAARGVAGMDSERAVEGAIQQLRNLGVSDTRIREVRETGKTPLTLDWLAPATGDVIEKNVINGQRVRAGDELFRIADHTRLWVIADVAEADLPMLKPGMRATVTFRAYPMQPVEGAVTFIYPELRAETRTARVRIEVPNPDGRLKVDMYADVVFQAGADDKAVTAVPVSALIDSGTRQVVLVARGEGRFEPRAVKVGRSGGGYVEILEGINTGEDVVTSATFLIDAESNLKAALQAFTQPEPAK
jgi:membrane fusion protein, copper/silver efflux system